MANQVALAVFVPAARRRLAPAMISRASACARRVSQPRTSTLTGQLEALKAAGAEAICREKISGARADRPQLTKLMTALKAGDAVVVTKLYRLGRSTRELLDLIEHNGSVGAVTARSPLGHLVSARSTLLAAIAEFERD